jgi:hypothetical protein
MCARIRGGARTRMRTPSEARPSIQPNMPTPQLVAKFHLSVTSVSDVLEIFAQHGAEVALPGDREVVGPIRRTPPRKPGAIGRVVVAGYVRVPWSACSWMRRTRTRRVLSATAVEQCATCTESCSCMARMTSSDPSGGVVAPSGLGVGYRGVGSGG